jgi:predicted DsbA family dithiol-disulfide isomerase
VVDVVWLPFELHPEVPPEGMARGQLLPAEYRERVEAGLKAMAADTGLEMRRPERLINSRLALSAAEFARERDAFPAMHLALFQAHWEGTGALDSVEDLKRIGAGVGLEPEELEAALDEGRYEDVLDANRLEATQVGINAIPAHILGRRFLILGAQPIETFRDALAKLADDSTGG